MPVKRFSAIAASAPAAEIPVPKDAPIKKENAGPTPAGNLAQNPQYEELTNLVKDLIKVENQQLTLLKEISKNPLVAEASDPRAKTAQETIQRLLHDLASGSSPVSQIEKAVKYMDK